MDKALKKIVASHLSQLEASSKNFEDIYKIMFSERDRTLGEENDGFRIRKHSFGQIKQRIDHLSAVLAARFGSSNRWIGLEMENSILWVIAFWAILRSGNRPYLINMRHPAALAGNLIRTLGIDTILAQTPGALDASYYCVSELEQEAAEALITPCFADEMALSTSATTLKQVICFYTGKQISHQLLNSGDIVRSCPQIAGTYKGELKQLALLPFYHVFGLFAVYFWFSFFGTTIVFLANNAPSTILKTCRKHNVTHIFAVPMFWHEVADKLTKELSSRDAAVQKKFTKAAKFCTAVQNIFPSFGLRLTHKLLHSVTDSLFGDSLRFCISGGSYIRTSALELLNSVGCCLHNGYGMSEVGITSVEQSCKPKQMNRNAIGTPFGSVSYRISPNGTLLIKGDSLCSRMQINGEEVGMPQWFDSGDVVVLENNTYFIRGRMGDAVIGENGENINPDLIEQAIPIHGFEGVSAFTVLGLEETEQETLSLVVQIDPRISDAALQALIHAVYAYNEALPLTTAVQAFYITYDPIMPKSAVKVGRQYLKRAIANGDVTLIPFSEAKAAQQIAGEDTDPVLLEQVRLVVASVLDIAPETLTNDAHLIFEAGASSLQYLSVIVALEEKFSCSGLLEEGKNAYTVKELCRQIERQL